MDCCFRFARRMQRQVLDICKRDWSTLLDMQRHSVLSSVEGMIAHVLQAVHFGKR